MTRDGTTIEGTSGEPGDDGRDRLAAARVVEETSVRIQRQLGHIRMLMNRLDPALVGISASRLEALQLGYDVYVRMLADALAETAGGLRSQAGPSLGRESLGS